MVAFCLSVFFKKERNLLTFLRKAISKDEVFYTWTKIMEIYIPNKIIFFLLVSAMQSWTLGISTSIHRESGKTSNCLLTWNQRHVHFNIQLGQIFWCQMLHIFDYLKGLTNLNIKLLNNKLIKHFFIRVKASRAHQRSRRRCDENEFEKASRWLLDFYAESIEVVFIM